MNKHEQASELVSKIDLSDNNTDRAQSKLTDLDSESINDRDPELAVLFIYVGPYQTMLSSFPRVKHGRSFKQSYYNLFSLMEYNPYKNEVFLRGYI